MSEPAPQPLPETPETYAFHQPEDPAGSSEEAPVKRLPAISLLFLISGAVRSMVAVLVFVFLSRGFDPFMTFAIGLLLIPSVIGAVARYLAFSYRLEDEELVIRDGILTRKVRSVPYARIQNVDLVQNLFHRLLKVAVVRLETASGGKPEAVIHVLTLPAVDELKSHILRGKSDPRSQGRSVTGSVTAGSELSPSPEALDRPDNGEQLLSIPPGRLALLGLLSNRGMLVVAAAAGLAQQAGFFDDPTRYLPDSAQLPQLESTFQTLRHVTWNPLWVLAALATVALTLLLFTRLLSALWVLVTLYGFKLQRDGNDLRTEYGLLTKVTATVPRKRIQLLSIKESFLQTRWGLASVQIETAGGGAEESGQGPGAARLWLAPIMDRPELVELIRQAMPQIHLRIGDLPELDWQPLAPRARLRLMRRGLALVVIIAAISVLTFGPWGLLSALLIPLVGWHAHRYTQRTAWAVTDHAVLFRSGAWGLRTSMVPFAKIQGLRIVQSPFDRRNRMASVRVDTAGANPSGHRIDVPYLETHTAHRLVERLENEAAELQFSW